MDRAEFNPFTTCPHLLMPIEYKCSVGTVPSQGAPKPAGHGPAHCTPQTRLGSPRYMERLENRGGGSERRGSPGPSPGSPFGSQCRRPAGGEALGTLSSHSLPAAEWLFP